MTPQAWTNEQIRRAERTPPRDTDPPTIETNWDRPCRTCRAQPGQPCRRPNGDKYTTVQGTPKFHAARQSRRMNGGRP